MNIFGLKKNKAGYTLLEITVALSLFTVLVLTATGIFKSVTQSQRSALASQNIQESLRFGFEMMSREIRTARGNHSGSLCAPDGAGGFTSGYYKVFNTSSGAMPPDSGNILYFQNREGECVHYATTTAGQLETRRASLDGTSYSYIFPITPDEIEIRKLEFFVVDDIHDGFHSVQPRVTIVMEAQIKSLKAEEDHIMKLQTTVSSRYYE